MGVDIQTCVKKVQVAQVTMADHHKRYLLLRALLVLLSSGLAIRGVVTAGPGPSVYYIDDSMRQFLMAPNLTFPQQNATVVLSGSNLCTCQSLCYVQGPTLCQAWSVVRESTLTDSWECRLINTGPETTDLLPDPNATYYFKQSSVLGTYSLQPDKLLYVALIELYNYDAARARCARIPGHRLIIVKSRETFQFFTSLWRMKDKTFWLADLRKISPTETKWGDGSDMSVTSGSFIVNNDIRSDVFVSKDMSIDDKSDVHDGPFRVLCQANPLGIEW